MNETLENIRHLYSRAAFGLNAVEFRAMNDRTLDQVINELFENAKVANPLQIIDEADTVNNREMLKQLKKLKSDSSADAMKQKREILKKSIDLSQSLNTTWVRQMIDTQSQFAEKMTLFWHGHFACRDRSSFHLQQLNNIHRSLGLGNFRDLLMAVSKSPAMLIFLNNQQNKKQHPNENFARELMELFTMGRGNYTEQDVKEAARAFTGWSFNFQTSEFVFKKSQHDTGIKTFLGQKGNFTGDEIISIILEKKVTAQFISQKLYKYFVNYTPNPENVNELAETLYDSNYDIARTMQKMFNSSWFYDDSNKGNRVKSPVEYIVSLNRMFDLHYNDIGALLLMQRSMGQLLFFPPNVSGWPGDRNWIDSNTLLTRLQLASTLIDGGQIELSGAADPEEEAEIAINDKYINRMKHRLSATIDWDKFIAGLPQSYTMEDLISLLLPAGLTPEKYRYLLPLTTENVRDLIVQIVSLPEYQLC